MKKRTSKKHDHSPHVLGSKGRIKQQYLRIFKDQQDQNWPTERLENGEMVKTIQLVYLGHPLSCH